MMKEKQIRTIIPFVIVFLSTFFLAEAEMFDDFGSRLDMIKSNQKLLGLLISSDGLQAIASMIIAVVFYHSWSLNKHRPFWFNDLMWQLAGAFFCWFLASVISIVGTFWSFLWLSGLFKLFSGVFLFYVANTVWAARMMFYHPEIPEEALKKAAKFTELLEFLKEGK